MLNRGYINRLPINRGMSQADGYPLHGSWAETLQGWATIGADYAVQQRLYEQVNGHIILTEGIRAHFLLAETLAGTATGAAGIKRIYRLAENLGGSLAMGANMYYTRMWEEALGGLLRMGATHHYAGRFSEALMGTAYMGAHVYVTRAFWEMLNGYANANNITDLRCYLDGEIPPGGKLVIDSEHYNVLLNDENRMAWQRGDWISVGPDTMSITLSQIGGESYRMEVYYIALYL